MIENDRQNMPRSGVQWRGSQGQFIILICNDDDELIPCCRFWQRAQNIHGNKFQGPVGGKTF